MAVGHLTIRRYKINIRPENFRSMIFQWFGEAADLIVGQMLCSRYVDIPRTVEELKKVKRDRR